MSTNVFVRDLDLTVAESKTAIPSLLAVEPPAEKDDRDSVWI